MYNTKITPNRQLKTGSSNLRLVLPKGSLLLVSNNLRNLDMVSCILSILTTHTITISPPFFSFSLSSFIFMLSLYLLFFYGVLPNVRHTNVGRIEIQLGGFYGRVSLCLAATLPNSSHNTYCFISLRVFLFLLIDRFSNISLYVTLVSSCRFPFNIASTCFNSTPETHHVSFFKSFESPSPSSTK